MPSTVGRGQRVRTRQWQVDHQRPRSTGVAALRASQRLALLARKREHDVRLRPGALARAGDAPRAGRPQRKDSGLLSKPRSI